MGKLYAAARALAVLVAIAAAFTTIPYVAIILLVLGALVGVGNTPEDNIRVFLIAIVLTLGSKMLEAIPGAGVYLSTIFSGIGMAAFGSSVSGIAIGLYRRTMSDWTGAKAT